MRTYFLVFFAFAFFNGLACINTYEHKHKSSNSHGEETEHSKSYRPFIAQFDSLKTHQYLANMKGWYGIDYKVESDIAAYELKCGNYKIGLDMLVGLHDQHPEEYNIIANLGTAYELVGQNDSALKYIQMGYDMNQSSHRGSEYIHVLILKAKIGLEQDPNYLDTHKIFNITTRNAAPLEKDSEKYQKFIRGESHIVYQLRERIPFTPKNDKIMGQILIELGDLQAYTYSIENAYKSYQLALLFDPYNPTIKSRITETENINTTLNINNSELASFLAPFN